MKFIVEIEDGSTQETSKEGVRKALADILAPHTVSIYDDEKATAVNRRRAEKNQVQVDWNHDGICQFRCPVCGRIHIVDTEEGEVQCRTCKAVFYWLTSPCLVVEINGTAETEWLANHPK